MTMKYSDVTKMLDIYAAGCVCKVGVRMGAVVDWSVGNCPWGKNGEAGLGLLG